MIGINRQTVSGNLAKDAVIRSAGSNSDCLSMRIISNERWVDGKGHTQTRSCGHDIIQFGPRGSFDDFARELLKEGFPVFAVGRVDRESNEVNGVKFRNVLVNASCIGGVLCPADANMQINTHEISGYLIADAEIHEAGNGKECLSFLVATNVVEIHNGKKYEYKSIHPVVRFEKKNRMNKLLEKLKKGAGVYLIGKTDKKKNEQNGETYYNATINVSDRAINIHRYVTPKPVARQSTAA